MLHKTQAIWTWFYSHDSTLWSEKKNNTCTHDKWWSRNPEGVHIRTACGRKQNWNTFNFFCKKKTFTLSLTQAKNIAWKNGNMGWWIWWIRWLSFPALFGLGLCPWDFNMAEFWAGLFFRLSGQRKERWEMMGSKWESTCLRHSGTGISGNQWDKYDLPT